MTMRLRLLATFVAAVLVTAGCTDSGEPPAPDVLRVGVSHTFSLFPSGHGLDQSERLITSALWTPLADYDPATGKVTPRAAESISSGDRTTWTVKLKEGGRFHDDTPVTAQSYVDTWTAIGRETWPGSRILKDLVRAKTITALDARTIQLVLDRPSGQIPALLSSPSLVPLSASALRIRDWTGPEVRPIGNGPFRLQGTWLPSGGTLIRVADAPGKVRVIELKVRDADAQYEEVKAGTLDLATEVTAGKHHLMEADFGPRHLTWALPEVAYLGFPLSVEQFSDTTIRHAFSLGIDRAALQHGALANQVDPARSLLPPSAAPGERSSTCRPCTFDPDAAKALLNQAGFSGVASVYFGETRGTWAPALKEHLSSTLGIALLFPGTTGPPDGPFAIDLKLATPSPQEVLTEIVKATGYRSDGFADLMKSAEETEATDSGEVYRLAENQLLRDLPVAPLWSGHGHAVWAERVTDVKATSFGSVDLSGISVR